MLDLKSVLRWFLHLRAENHNCLKWDRINRSEFKAAQSKIVPGRNPNVFDQCISPAGIVGSLQIA
jgi:hypothetical protein